MALVKPQFEAGRDDVGRGGLVTDPGDPSTRVRTRSSAAAAEVGLARIGMIESPITGAEGNREFLLHLRRRAAASDRRSRDAVMRIAVVARHNLTAARDTLVALENWLQSRDTSTPPGRRRRRP